MWDQSYKTIERWSMKKKPLFSYKYMFINIKRNSVTTFSALSCLENEQTETYSIKL